MNEDILAFAVIQQAAYDWRAAIKPSNPKAEKFIDCVRRKSERLKEIRKFFGGQNADLFSGGQARIILGRLEEEYQGSKGRLQIEAYKRGEIG